MPGLWDCHGHFLGSRFFDLARLPQESIALRAARSARDLTNALNAGITSVREVGGLGVHLARAVAEGILDGPAIYPAGAILSTTGGHGDLHCYPLSWVTDFGRQDGALRLADGTAECMRAVREQLRARRAGDQGVRLRRRPVRSGQPDPSAVHRRRTADHRGDRGPRRPGGGRALSRQARHHGRDRGGRADDRARQLPGRGSVRRDAGARHDPGADPQHHRGHPDPPGRGAAVRGRQAHRARAARTRTRCGWRSSAACRSRWAPTSG